MKTEKVKMLAGKLYDPLDPQLVVQRWDVFTQAEATVQKHFTQRMVSEDLRFHMPTLA